MKKLLLLSAILTLALAASFTSAQSGISARSSVVQMKAIVPEYIGFSVVNNEAVVFNGSAFAQGISEGAPGTASYVAASSLPTWNLSYNLKQNRIVTVCGFASDFTGDSAAFPIPARYLNGTSAATGVHAAFGNLSNCSNGGELNAILLDTITTGTANTDTSTQNAGKPRLEGFTTLGLGGANVPQGFVPTPDTYNGTLYIVAQAQ